ncbi:DUF5808 domain-containing protein [Paenibacillus sp. R14(2021)]|uniref:DUF5808 domain-containing protein n=1 Tax=Paenibacillus sp. R14(2021) TaxID=2859228 RepID=UPI001C613D74|nr:DUF5808 domain-containing protein [Paenibacillus sp. R14(2021)]
MKKQETERRSSLPLQWYGLQGLLILGSVLAAVLCWDKIPGMLTTHYNIRFEPDGYEAKSWGTVFMLNIVQTSLLVTLLVVNAAIAAAKSPSGSEEGAGADRQRVFSYANSVFLYGLSLLLTTYFSYIQATMLYGWPSSALAAVSIAALVLIIGGVGGLMLSLRRLGRQVQAGSPDEDHWIAGGIVYYNPKDPAVFVAKKYGIGWTVNLGRPPGWIVTGMLILIPFIIVALVARMT